MEKMLKVTPEKLIEAAGEFQNSEATIRSITEEMIAIVDGFKPVWQGEAATGFANRFSSLSEVCVISEKRMPECWRRTLKRS